MAEKRTTLLLVSGKRKCGKDYVSRLIQERIGSELAMILHISDPLKREYAEIHKLDFEKLMDSTSYKETYRSTMVEWSTRKRENDSAYFCRKAIEPGEQSKRPIWIIADVRRHTDIRYFDQYSNLKLRLEATDSTRKKRGWVFTQGIDDSETEINLDDYKGWDFVIENDDDNEQLKNDISSLCTVLLKSVTL